MHVVQETFHTLHLHTYEAARVHNELTALAEEAGADITDYPALSAFLSAISFAAEVDDSANVVVEITPEPNPSPE